MSIMLGLFNVGGGEIILILAIVLILFGAKKLPELAKGLGQGIREFKKATDSASEGLREAIEGSPPIRPRRLPPSITASSPSESAASQAPSDVNS
jgi:sec-independent protein translocase protein TatA